MSDDKNTDLEKRNTVPGYMQGAAEHWGAQQARVLRDTICHELDPPEFALFVEVCRRKQLDPFSRQIHAVKRWNSQAGRKTMTIQVGIDGFRTTAERTGKYAGQRGPFWCGADGVWLDVWLSDEPPKAAKVEVLRHDFAEPLTGVALFQEYAQTKRGGGLNSMWAQFSTVMLAKCAESIALRRAFPEELSGLYTDEEMRQAEGAVIVEQPLANDQTTGHMTDQCTGTSLQTGSSDDVVDADFDDQPRRAPRTSGASASGASATRTLLGYVHALDTCENEDDLTETITAWKDRIDALPRGGEYVEAYEEFTQARVTNDESTRMDVSKVHLVEAIESMKQAARTFA
jgi:phage recombination protein Bet